jgi:hypothetical protein
MKLHSLRSQGIRIAAISAAVLGFAATNGNCQLPEGDLANGLIGYYALDGNADDTSGKTNNGVPTNLTYSTNRFGVAGAAGNFSQGQTLNQAYVTIPNFSSLNNYPVTFSVWFTLNSLVSGTNGSIMTLIGKEAAGARNEGAVALTTGGLSGQYTNRIGYIGFSTNYLPPNENFITGFTPNTNQWYNLIFTYDVNQVARFYTDGVEIAQQTYENILTNNMQFRIGSSSSGVDNTNARRPSWDGLIDDVTIYNRALSPTEVTELYNFQAVPEPSTYALVGLGCLALLGAAIGRKRRS